MEAVTSRARNWRGQTDGLSMWVLKSARQENTSRKSFIAQLNSLSPEEAEAPIRLCQTVEAGNRTAESPPSYSKAQNKHLLITRRACQVAQR